MNTRRGGTSGRTAAGLLVVALGFAPALGADDGDPTTGWGTNGLAGPVEELRWNAGADGGASVGVFGVADWTDDEPAALATSFWNGTGGVVSCGAAVFGVTDFEGHALLLDGRGQWLVGGAAKFGTDQTFGLVARLAHGSCGLDPDWSGSGFEIFDDAPFCDTESCRIVALAEAPGDRLYALLESPQTFLTAKFVVVAFEPDGDLDPSFGSGGMLELPIFFEGALAGPAFLGITPRFVDNELFVYLNRYDPDTAEVDLDPILVLLRLDGSYDTLLQISDNDSLDQRASSLAVKDGYVAVGVDTIAGDADVGYVYQLWWRGGFRSEILAIDDNGAPVALAFQGDRKLLVAVENAPDDPDERTRILRYAQGPDGPVADDSFGADPGNVVFVDVDTLGGTADTAIALVPSPGAISVLGNATGFAADPTPHTFTGAFELRLENRLLFADGFESGWTNLWSH